MGAPARMYIGLVSVASPVALSSPERPSHGARPSRRSHHLRSCAMLLAAALLVGCFAPWQDPSQLNDESQLESILVVGFLADVHRGVSSPPTSCDRTLLIHANFSARRLAYATQLGLTLPQGGSHLLELSEVRGPDMGDCSERLGLEPESRENALESVALGEFKRRIEYSASHHGVIQVAGVMLREGDYWHASVDTRINGTDYRGNMVLMNLGQWPIVNLTEFACNAPGCSPPFFEKPDLARHAAESGTRVAS